MDALVEKQTHAQWSKSTQDSSAPVLYCVKEMGRTSEGEEVKKQPQ